MDVAENEAARAESLPSSATPSHEPEVLEPHMATEFAPSAPSAKVNAPLSLIPATRPPYIPQFTAATQMILKRMKSEANGLGSVPPIVWSAPSTQIKSSTYEDVKRRLVMGMATASMTMQMPAPPPPPVPTINGLKAQHPRRVSTGMSAIRRISSGLTSTRKAKPAPAKGSNTGVAPQKMHIGMVSISGHKRKRISKSHDGDTSSLSSLTDLSDVESITKEVEPTPLAPPEAPPTTTKSGRQVLKPTTYVPGAGDATQSNGRRRGGNKAPRTAEQALCRRCTRLHSPASNQMVFCDGCNDGWHQMCHEPRIEDATIRDLDRPWFCAPCQAKRDRHFGVTSTSTSSPASKRLKTENGKPGSPNRRVKGSAGAGRAGGESWAGRTPQQKRAYLLTLQQPDLVALIMQSLELHPDLPIFPVTDSGMVGSKARTESGPLGPAKKSVANGVSSSPGKGKGTSNGAHYGVKDEKDEKGQSQQDDEDYDPLDPPWPKAGQGLYSRLPPEAEDQKHLVDDDDYEAFSVIVYDENGRKIEENGIKVVDSKLVILTIHAQHPDIFMTSQWDYPLVPPGYADMPCDEVCKLITR